MFYHCVVWGVYTHHDKDGSGEDAKVSLAFICLKLRSPQEYKVAKAAEKQGQEKKANFVMILCDGGIPALLEYKVVCPRPLPPPRPSIDMCATCSTFAGKAHTVSSILCAQGKGA